MASAHSVETVFHPLAVGVDHNDYELNLKHATASDGFGEQCLLSTLKMVSRFVSDGFTGDVRLPSNGYLARPQEVTARGLPFLSFTVVGNEVRLHPLSVLVSVHFGVERLQLAHAWHYGMGAPSNDSSSSSTPLRRFNLLVATCDVPARFTAASSPGPRIGKSKQPLASSAVTPVF